MGARHGSAYRGSTSRAGDGSGAMSGFLGGQPEQMRQHGVACGQGAQRIVDITDTVSAFVDSVPWLGPDAMAFRALWHGSIKPGMLAKAEDIRMKGEEITQHAEEQDEVSDPSDGSFFDIIGDIFEDIFGGGLGPGGGIGSPLGPDVLDHMRDALGLGGKDPEQSFYGDPGYGSRGKMYGQDRPVGDEFTWNPDLLPGREVENEAGYIDVHAGANYSGGTNVTTDDFGNTTGTIGGRGSLEAGIDEHLNLPGGGGIDASGKIGAEAYGEAGGTIGPDGFSGGARAGAGVYGEVGTTITGADGSSAGITTSGYVGAEAHANAYSHATRNADGNINGWSSGFDAGAFAGAQATQKFEATSPGGWFSGSTSISEKAGAGASIGAGATVSTDEISFTVGGSAAKGLGLGGTTTIGVHPNAIVESITPGDYNLDDAIKDGGSIVRGAAETINRYNPFT